MHQPAESAGDVDEPERQTDRGEAKTEALVEEEIDERQKAAGPEAEAGVDESESRQSAPGARHIDVPRMAA